MPSRAPLIASLFLFAVPAPAQAADEIARWVDRLGSQDRVIWSEAGLKLVDYGPKAIPALLKAASQRDAEYTARVAVTIRRMGGDAIPALIAQLEQSGPDDDAVAVVTVAALSRFGKDAIEPLKKMLRPGSRKVKSRAAMAFMCLDQDGRLALIEAVKLGDVEARREAAEALSLMAKDLGNQAETLKAFAELSRNNDDRVANACVDGIYAIGIDACRPMLLTMLNTGEWNEADVAARVLVRFGEVSIPDLIAALAAKPFQNGQSREFMVASALEKIGDKSVSPLIQALQNDNPLVVHGATTALAKFGPRATRAIHDLIQVLRSKDYSVATNSASALKEIGNEAIPPLVGALRDGDGQVRRFAGLALANFGMDALDELVKALRSDDPTVRGAAAQALAYMRMGNFPRDDESIKRIRGLLGSEDPRVRRGVATAFRLTQTSAADDLPQLIGRFSDDDPYVKAEVANAILHRYGKGALPAITPLRNDSSARVRVHAAFLAKYLSVGRYPRPEEKLDLGPDDLLFALTDNDPSKWAVAAYQLRGAKVDFAPAIKALQGRLGAVTSPAQSKEGNEAIFAKQQAAYALSNMEWLAEKVVPALLNALYDSEIRADAGDALATLVERLGELPGAGGKSAARGVAERVEAALTARLGADSEPVVRVRKVIRQFLAEDMQSWKEWLHKSRTVLIGMGVLALVGLYFLALRFLVLPRWPLAVLAWGESLKPYEVEVSVPLVGKIKLSLRQLLLVGLLSHHRLVLDAWVARYIVRARRALTQGTTYRSRRKPVVLPAKLDGRNIPVLTPEGLRSVCSRESWYLAIQGVGGIGKTTVALQLALWAMQRPPSRRLCPDRRMIPVLIEPDSETYDVCRNLETFNDAIVGKLRNMIGGSERLPADLVERLLRTRRILVILDGLSEMPRDLATPGNERAAPTNPGFPAAALIVTTRDYAPPGAKNVLDLTKLNGENLVKFMSDSIAMASKLSPDDMPRDRPHVPTEPELLKACARLVETVQGRRPDAAGPERFVTPLLAKLYVEQIMHCLVDGGTVEDLAGSVPELVLNYLNILNRYRRPGDPDDATVYAVAGAVAWQCIIDNFWPGPVPRRRVLERLTDIDHAADRLDDLEMRLKLVRTTVPSKDEIVFDLDTVAEYLAARHCVGLYGGSKAKWTSFLKKARAQAGAPASIRGFLVAVQDSCLAEDAEKLAFVINEIGRFLNETAQTSEAPPPVAQ